MENKKPPKVIIDTAKIIVNEPILTGRFMPLDQIRNKALEAISVYKRAKSEALEQLKEKQEILEWLKQFDNDNTN